jgi:hypothetical protein
LAGQSVQITEQLDGTLVISFEQQVLEHQACDRTVYVKPAADTKALNPRVQTALNERRRPDKTHPWKRWVGTTPNPQFQPIAPT